MSAMQASSPAISEQANSSQRGGPRSSAPISGDGTCLGGSDRSAPSSDALLGRRIKDVRRKLGLTQKQVAASVGITGPQFHRYEVGVTRVATTRLIAIATALGVQPEQLMSEAAPVRVAMQPAANAVVSGDLVELVELFSSLVYRRQRAATVAFARSLASKTGSAAVVEFESTSSQTNC